MGSHCASSWLVRELHITLPKMVQHSIQVLNDAPLGNISQWLTSRRLDRLAVNNINMSHFPFVRSSIRMLFKRCYVSSPTHNQGLPKYSTLSFPSAEWTKVHADWSEKKLLGCNFYQLWQHCTTSKYFLTSGASLKCELSGDVLISDCRSVYTMLKCWYTIYNLWKITLTSSFIACGSR